MTIQKMRRAWHWPSAFLVLSGFTHFARLSDSPPGLSGDAARLGLQAMDFLQLNLWPFYIVHQFAPNPLLIYLQAPLFLVAGANHLTLRGLTAAIGALTAPCVYVSARALWAERGQAFAHRAGWLAAMGLALSPFLTMYDRQGIETPLLPVLELVCVTLLWRGLRRGRMSDFVLMGVTLGLSQYAYIVARFFPAALGVAGLVVGVAQPNWRRRWHGLAIGAVIAAAIAMPQWWLFIQSPYTFAARTQLAAGQFVFQLPDAPALFLSKLINQAQMLGWHWDNAHNPSSGRPLLDAALFSGLLIGLLVAVRQRHPAHRFVLLLSGLMLIPDLIAYEGLWPSANRISGAVPFLFLLAGMGGATLWTMLGHKPHPLSWSAYLVPLAVVAAGLEGQLDFATRVRPLVNAAAGLEWRASLVELAEADFILAHRASAMLIPRSEYQRAPLAFLLAQAYPARRSGWPLPLHVNDVLLVIRPAAPNRPTTEGLPSGYLPDEWVLLKDGGVYFLPPTPGALSATSTPKSLSASNGALASTTYSARWVGYTPTVLLAPAMFNNGLDIIGYSATEFAPGQPLTVTFYWQPQRRIVSEVQLFVQVLNQNGAPIAALHDWPLRGAYRVVAWRPGEVMPLSYELLIPDSIRPGLYRLVVGVFDVLSQERVLIQTGADMASIAQLKVALPPNPLPPTQSLSAEFGDEIRLSGYTLTTTESTARLALYWQARQTPAANYTVFVHILDANDNLIAQSDAQPMGGQYPTSIWDAGESVTDEHTLSMPPGEYTVWVGLYRLDTLERLPVSVNGQFIPEARLSLGVIRVP